MITWGVVDCIERNGEIISYTVEFQQQGVVVLIPVEVTGTSFTDNQLIPGIHYDFRVAAINSIGRGPFTDSITISTTEIGMPQPQLLIWTHKVSF